MERKKQHTQKDLQRGLIESIIIFIILFALLIIHTWPLFQASHLTLINGFLTGLLLVIFLFSLAGLKFETLIRKTVFKYQINALLWRFIALLTYFLKPLSETPSYPEYLLIFTLAVFSISFDYTAFKVFQSTDLDTMKSIVRKHDNPLENHLIKQYEAHITLLKKTAFLAVVYFFIIGGFDYTFYFQLIFMLFTIFILLYQYIRLKKANPTLNIYFIIAMVVTATFLSLQFISYHEWNIEFYVYHFMLLWLGFSPIFIFYIYFQTKLNNHQNIALLIESFDT